MSCVGWLKRSRLVIPICALLSVLALYAHWTDALDLRGPGPHHPHHGQHDEWLSFDHIDRPHPAPPLHEPGRPSPTRPKLKVVEGAAELAAHPAPLPPDFPPAASLPHPSTFVQYAARPAAVAPSTTPFPNGRLAEIRPAGASGRLIPASGTWTPPPSSFASNWTGVLLGEEERTMPRIQHDFAGFQEGRVDKKLRLARKHVVKNAFLHAWKGYKTKAWGDDEIRPVRGVPSSPFMQWGATIVDSLDTLLIMELPEEFAHAREHVRQLDFGIISGIDWGRVSDSSGRRTVSIHAFETVIRYLGGLLGAYDLSGDPLLLDRAEELGKIILPIFDSSSGVPLSRINPKFPMPTYTGHEIQLAEAGTLLLEYTRLSQLTGNKTYFDLAHRATIYMKDNLGPRSPHKGLLPTMFNTERWSGGHMGTYSFGGMADSHYEYLIKEHLLLRGAVSSYKDMYTDLIDTARGLLLLPVPVPGKDLLTVGELKNGGIVSTMEHLTCFLGAIMGLGARLLSRPTDLSDARRLSQTCYYLGSIHPTGMQPERTELYQVDEPGQTVLVVDKESGEEVSLPRNIPGVKQMFPHYISRPESIETIFYLYRLTGDRRYQDQGWRMFSDWIRVAETDWGFSSIIDVRDKKPRHGDNMESFVMAETFKYYYLLQCEPTFLSLDSYVLNTEAHPFIHDPLIKSGAFASASALLSRAKEDWTAVPDEDIGEGTDVQKWAVLKEVEAFAKLQAEAQQR